MVSSVSQNLVRTSEPVTEDRLLDLFWNRAELKKEFARLRQERDELRDRLRQQEGEILRRQQRLEQLEGLLSDPAQAMTVAVYYQLRGLWAWSARQLRYLLRELSDQEQERQTEAERCRFEALRARELELLDSRLDTARAQVRAARQALVATKRRNSGLRWLLFRHRSRLEVDAAQSVFGAAQARYSQLQAKREEKLSEVLEPTDSLSLAARRRINLALIAMAQELVLHFDTDELAGLARDASARALKDVSFGTPSDCRKISRRLARRLMLLESSQFLPAKLHCRRRYLAMMAQFRNESDVLPVAASVACIPLKINADGHAVGRAALEINVLTEEYWDLYSVLLR